MISIDDRVNTTYDFDILEKIKDALSQSEVELILTDDAEIQALNREYRNIDKATDVLSFPLEQIPYMPLGTIVISVDHIKDKAAELGHSEQDELSLLFIHGMLHLLGYDHEVDHGEMRQREKELILEFGLPDSLILRNL